MKNQKGFSLIELLIVVVIIGIIAAIAIPNLVASRRASHEASAISTIRGYSGAQVTYQTSLGAGNFAGVSGSIQSLGALADIGLMDESFRVANPADESTKSGYRFSSGAIAANGIIPSSHGIVALPIVDTGFGQTGTRKFVMVSSGVIHADDLTGPLWYTEVNGYYEVVNPRPLNY